MTMTGFSDNFDVSRFDRRDAVTRPIREDISDAAAVIVRRDAAERAATLQTPAEASAAFVLAVNSRDEILTEEILKAGRRAGWLQEAEIATGAHAVFHDVATRWQATGNAQTVQIDPRQAAAAGAHSGVGNQAETTRNLNRAVTDANRDLRQKALDNASPQLIAALAAVRKTADKHAAAAQTSFEAAWAAIATPTGGINEQLLVEVRSTRAWDRLKRELDAIPSELNVLAKVGEWIRDADAVTLRVLVEEAESYARSRGISSVDSIRAAAESRPELAEPKKRRDRAAKLQAVVAFNVVSLTKAIAALPPASGTAMAREADQWHEPLLIRAAAYVDPRTVNYEA